MLVRTVNLVGFTGMPLETSLSQNSNVWYDQEKLKNFKSNTTTPRSNSE